MRKSYLIQILLPLYDNSGRAFKQSQFTLVALELANRFGGVTAFTRSPAEGMWKRKGRQAKRDDLVVYEVMTATLQRSWWRRTRIDLQKRFRQERIVIHAHRITVL